MSGRKVEVAVVMVEKEEDEATQPPLITLTRKLRETFASVSYLVCALKF